MECRFHLGFDAMVAANAADPVIERLVIRRGTACDKNARALASELAADAPANAFGGTSDDCDSTV
jgi:hypothetical protein